MNFENMSITITYVGCAKARRNASFAVLRKLHYGGEMGGGSNCTRVAADISS